MREFNQAWTGTPVAMAAGVVLTVLSLLTSSSPAAGQQAQSVMVEVTQGLVRGTTRLVNGRIPVSTFLGIPYAEPPLGKARFRDSVPHRGWQSPYLADTFGPPCPQPSASRSVKEYMQEDCLYLNVWTTVLPRGPVLVPVPVIIFFEGQLFTMGNPSDVPAEDLAASQGMVVVSAAYRLNALGFLSLETEKAPGNAGLSDQALVLQWVYDNIGGFGGDPEQITLLGHSAGAASIIFHLMNQVDSFKIKRAIMMSGSALAPWSLQPNARANGFRLAGIVGCQQQDEELVLECLQTTSMESLVAGVGEMVFGGNISALFAPVIDSSFVSAERARVVRAPEEAIRSIRQVPMILGSVPMEGVLMAYFLKNKLDALELSDIGTFLRDTVVPSVLAQRSSGDRLVDNLLLTQLVNYEYNFSDDNIVVATKGQVYDRIIRFFGDVYFDSPLEKQLQLLSQTNSDIYLYTNGFPFEDPLDVFGNALGVQNASHGVDLLFLFGPATYRRFIKGTSGFLTFTEERFALNMKTLFGGFAAAGRPPGDARWPRLRFRFTGDASSGRGLDEDTYYDLFWGPSGSELVPQLQQRRRGPPALAFWDGLLGRVAGAAGRYAVVAAGAAATASSIAEMDPTEENAATGAIGCTTYIALTWMLLAACVVLIAVFVSLLVIVVHRVRRKKINNFCNGPLEEETNSVFSVSRSRFATSGRQQHQHQQPHQIRPDTVDDEFGTTRLGGGWRDSVMDYRL